MAQFSAISSAIAAGSARDLFVITAPSDKRLMIRMIVITPDADNTEHAIYELYTAAAGAVTPGTAVTARCMEAYETTFNGTASKLPTVSGKTPAQALWREGGPFIYGFRWTEDCGVRQLWIGAGESLVIRQAFTTAVTSTVAVQFDEVD